MRIIEHYPGPDIKSQIITVQDSRRVWYAPWRKVLRHDTYLHQFGAFFYYPMMVRCSEGLEIILNDLLKSQY